MLATALRVFRGAMSGVFMLATALRVERAIGVFMLATALRVFRREL